MMRYPLLRSNHWCFLRGSYLLELEFIYYYQRIKIKMAKVSRYRCSVCGIDFSTWPEHRKHLQSRAHRVVANKGNVQLFLEKFETNLKKLDKEK